jgi:hypothetical protein
MYYMKIHVRIIFFVFAGPCPWGVQAALTLPGHQIEECQRPAKGCYTSLKLLAGHLGISRQEQHKMATFAGKFENDDEPWGLGGAPSFRRIQLHLW